MKIKVIIVDDEPLARKRISVLLKKEPDIEVTAECASGVEAIPVIRKSPPDLLFLDVQMPVMDGFAMLNSLDIDPLPLVIFVTAYDEHALAAFEVHALDYVLKPFKQSRFKQAVERAREQFEKNAASDLSRQLRTMLEGRKSESGYLARLVVRTPERVVFLRTEEIDWIEAASNYVIVHAGGQNHVLRETIGRLEASLSPEKFLRVSRSAVVNIDRIKELRPLMKGEYVIVLHNGQQLNMTRGIREVEAHLMRG